MQHLPELDLIKIDCSSTEREIKALECFFILCIWKMDALKTCSVFFFFFF